MTKMWTCLALVKGLFIVVTESHDRSIDAERSPSKNRYDYGLPGRQVASVADYEHARRRLISSKHGKGFPLAVLKYNERAARTSSRLLGRPLNLIQS